MGSCVIAVDARYGLQSPRRGIGEYVFQLMRRLADMPRSYDLRLYGDGSADPSVVREFQAAYAVEILSAPNFFWWEQRVFPLAVREHQLVHATANIAPLLSFVPVVMTVHDVIEWHRGHLFGGKIPWRHHLSRLYRMNALKRAAPRARLILTVSRHAARDIETVLGVPRERIVVTPLAPKYSPGEVTWPKDPYVLALGALDPRKNTAGMLEAARELTALGIGVKIVGMEARRLAQFLVPEVPNLEVLGMVGDDRLEELYRRAGCFVYPSLYEGFGLPVLEAMALGCPVVTGGNSSLPEVAGTAAALADTLDPHAIAQAVQQIMGDPVRQREMAEQGLAWAGTFDWQTTADLTHQSYEQVLRHLGHGTL